MKAPKYPDPTQTAIAQTGSNQSTAITQQLLNQTNQNTPWGSIAYNQTGTNSYWDPLQNKQVTLPQFTATTTLTPEQQALFNQQQQFDQKFNDLALQQTDKVSGILNTPFSYDPTVHGQWSNDLYDKLNTDHVNQQQESMAQRLANQGLQPGTPAYDDAMRNLTYSQDKARNDFELNSYGQGFQTALTNRNQPLNEIAALMGGQQVQQPQFAQTPTTGVNGVDYAGLKDREYQAKMQAYQSGMGGLFGLGSSLLGGMFALSDKRTKENKKEIGALKDGTKIYSYNYKPEFGGLFSVGVMAQEAEKKHPDAVMTGDDGYKRVNYSKIAEELAA